MKNFNSKSFGVMFNVSFPKFFSPKSFVGNLNHYRSPTKKETQCCFLWAQHNGHYKLVCLIFITLFFLIFPIFPQEEVREINYQSIKQMIQSGNLDRALKDVEDLLVENPGDATLALYQAEIWLDKGERFYQRRKYKSAFEQFEKVYKVWNNHAFVRQRYLELKDKKPLIDYEDRVSLTSLVPIGLQGTGNPQNSQESQVVSEKNESGSSQGSANEDLNWKNLDAKDQILYKHIIRLENLLIISLFLLGVINISLLYTIAKKK